jgi:hypothetical protein
MSVDINDNTPQAIKAVTKLSENALDGFVFRAKAHTKQIGMQSFSEPTGNHAGLIDSEKIGEGHYTLFSGSNYGAYLEFGTSRMTAQPHFRPGLQKAVSDYQRKGLWGD